MTKEKLHLWYLEMNQLYQSKYDYLDLFVFWKFYIWLNCITHMWWTSCGLISGPLKPTMTNILWICNAIQQFIWKYAIRTGWFLLLNLQHVDFLNFCSSCTYLDYIFHITNLYGSEYPELREQTNEIEIIEIIA